MLVDANILLFAVDSTSPWHRAASRWMTQALNGPRRVGLPWQSIVAFMRVSTHPRASQNPLPPEVAWKHVASWLQAPSAWIPGPTGRHAQVFGDLIGRYQLSGNLVSDAHLAALAIEHGLTMVSGDTDFARFQEVRWENPLA